MNNFRKGDLVKTIFCCFSNMEKCGIIIKKIETFLYKKSCYQILSLNEEKIELFYREGDELKGI